MGDELFALCIEAGGLGFYSLGGSLYVVQGWDELRLTGKDTWYHLQEKHIGPDQVFICQCPYGRQRACVHARFLIVSHYTPLLLAQPDTPFAATKPVVLFQRETHQEPHVSRFSVGMGGTGGIKHHVFITYHGPDGGEGQWNCSCHAGDPCVHVTATRTHLQACLQMRAEHASPEAADGSANIDSTVSPTRPPQLPPLVSHLPIAIPPWALLPGEAPPHVTSLPPACPPHTIPLMPSASCGYHTPRKFYDPLMSSESIPCTVYMLTCAQTHQLEVQACPACPLQARHHVGPDAQDHGLFNFNNRILVSHDLLDEYTSAYTLSETPFTAWTQGVSHHYTTYGSSQPFMSDDTFRHVWFAFVSLQDDSCPGDCPLCGPSPADTIWDGVTLAFNQKHLLPSLTPPTLSPPESISRTETRHVSQQQCIPDKRVRSVLRHFIDLQGCMQASPATAHLSSSGVRMRVSTSSELDYPDFIDFPPITALFMQVGLTLSHVCVSASWALKCLPQMSAEESVLQVVNRRAQNDLLRSVTTPNETTRTLLVLVPCVYSLVEHYAMHDDPYPLAVIAVIKWLLGRGHQTLACLLEGGSSLSDVAWGNLDADLQETGCFYTQPPIRIRPSCPRLPHDTRPEPPEDRGGQCSKYYSTYKTQGLTGGIMCCWCTHSICYGFHCIPHGEGRNDIFSAILTCWPVAPKLVVYDFACALGPYCLTREPEFFADTLFAIDDFHARGHTKCSPASFLSTYASLDPHLAKINTSAAECGNSGLHSICKSVSYMSQSHAIVYTHVFISIWNCLKRQRLAISASME
ncbi:hypothetical protein JB92DRAFT_3241490 [Gautieria morchelliformis]|nr:hypothetical protein JB92DRAFT_3241490 [Gautieria morchelliformis]